MKQLLQNLGSGITSVEEVPVPVALKGTLVIRSEASLISAGTERTLVEFGKSSLIEKARREPERVKQVLAKVQTDGLLATVDAVRSKLAQPIPLGYCNAGVVTAVGDDVFGFRVGDRVASNGPHAEFVRVPVNLAAKIPDGVSIECAAFVPLAAIALQSVRVAHPTLGETFVVLGLGLVGLLATQILIANGCRVIGIDPVKERCGLAASLGARCIHLSDSVDPVSQVMAMTADTGADGVIIAASTKSDEPLRQAAEMSRMRGRIVLVGVTGTSFDRNKFYIKELSFSVSYSYGPGRGDNNYEQRGHDYPIGFVRWTEKRNFEAVLGLMESGRLQTAQLITNRIPIDRAEEAYSEITTNSASLAVLLTYPDAGGNASRGGSRVILREPQDAAPRGSKAGVVVGFLGLGNYGSRMLAPAFVRAGATLRTAVTTGTPGSVTSAKSCGFRILSTDPADVFEGDGIEAVAIVTRHSSHAPELVRALQAGKSVFVEKPLAINREQVAMIKRWYSDRGTDADPVLMVGFNRRFSRFARDLKAWLDRRSEPASLVLLMNAGKISADHWTQDPSVGGGRIIGEACHMIDLARFLIGEKITRVQTSGMGNGDAAPVSIPDSATISLKFADGSIASVHYLANGSSLFPKERVEAFCGGGIAIIDNFVRSRGYGAPGFRSRKGWLQDKGHTACVAAFVDAVRHQGASPIGFDELIEVAEATIEASEAIAS